MEEDGWKQGHGRQVQQLKVAAILGECLLYTKCTPSTIELNPRNIRFHSTEG